MTNLFIGVQKDHRPLKTTWEEYITSTFPTFSGKVLVRGAFGWQPNWGTGMRSLLFNAHLVNQYPEIDWLVKNVDVRFFIGGPDFKVTRLESIPSILLSLRQLGVTKVVFEALQRWGGPFQLAYEVCKDLGIDVWLEGMPLEGDDVPDSIPLIFDVTRLSRFLRVRRGEEKDVSEVKNPLKCIIREDAFIDQGVIEGTFGKLDKSFSLLIERLNERNIEPFVYPKVADKL